MSYKHIKSRIKVPVLAGSKVKGYLNVSIHLLSGNSLTDVYHLCNRFRVNILSCVSLGGILNKKYMLHVEGYKSDIAKLEMLLNTL